MYHCHLTIYFAGCQPELQDTIQAMAPLESICTKRNYYSIFYFTGAKSI